MKESDLNFQFDATWHVKKYDATDYYLALSGKDFSAVDFVGLWHDEVVFIEVKNYSNRPADQLARTREKIFGNPPPLVKVFEEKVGESIEGIDLIGKALRRRWVTRKKYQLLQYLKLRPYLLRDKRLFWMYIDQKIKAQPEAVRLVLWMELPEELEQGRDTFEAALQAQLNPLFRQIKVASSEQHPFGKSVKVRVE